MKHLALFFLAVGLITLTNSQTCLGSNGEAVDWWLILKFPGFSKQTGFAYTDSSSTNHYAFDMSTVWPDSQNTALTRTLSQINDNAVAKQMLYTFAWNDDAPDFGTDSGTLAHSKGLISFNPDTKLGFQIVHSLPEYPSIILDASGNTVVNITIGSSQLGYGQHALCLSHSFEQLQKKVATGLLVTRINTYFSDVPNSQSFPNLYALGQKQSVRSTAKFEYRDLTLETTKTPLIKAIFKNGRITNSSIFEDGLANYLAQELVAETWGRPLQPNSCNITYPVTNARQIKLSESVTWKETNDHSKWAVSSDYACFGDMNRMVSQQKRGGAFYCISDQQLAQRIYSTISDMEPCLA